MAPSKRKSTVSRKNGQPTPSSSKMGTQSQTPASKTSQRHTPAPLNLKDASDGKKTNSSEKDQYSSAPPLKVTNGTKHTREPIFDVLTKANLSNLTKDHRNQAERYAKPPSSPLSSPPASMRGIHTLDEYLDQPNHEPVSASPAHDEVEEAAVEPVASLSSLERGTRPSKSPSKSREASTVATDADSANAAEAANHVQNLSQLHESDLVAINALSNGSDTRGSPHTHTTISAKKEMLIDASEADQDFPASVDAQIGGSAPNGLSGSSELSLVASSEDGIQVDATIQTHGSSALSSDDVPVHIEALNAASNGTGRQIRSRKRTILSVDEPSVPGPPVKIKKESSRVIVRKSRAKKSNSPCSHSQDEITSHVNQVAAHMDNEVHSNGEPVRRSKRAKNERTATIEFDPDDMELPYDEAAESDIEAWEGWLEMESSPVSLLYPTLN